MQTLAMPQAHLARPAVEMGVKLSRRAGKGGLQGPERFWKWSGPGFHWYSTLSAEGNGKDGARKSAGMEKMLQQAAEQGWNPGPATWKTSLKG
jgi:hypothetical protein